MDNMRFFEPVVPISLPINQLQLLSRLNTYMKILHKLYAANAIAVYITGEYECLKKCVCVAMVISLIFLAYVGFEVVWDSTGWRPHIGERRKQAINVAFSAAVTVTLLCSVFTLFTIAYKVYPYIYEIIKLLLTIRLLNKLYKMIVAVCVCLPVLIIFFNERRHRNYYPVL